jgi:hypothetical protein
MAGERITRILQELRSAGEAGGETGRLCGVCAAVASMSGAGIMLMSDEVPFGSVCTSDHVAALIEDLQFTLGEGPGVDAYRQDRPVLEPDLAEPANARWLAFSPPVVAAGARAAFAFPLQVGSVRLGALNFYSDRPGPLTDDQHADALVLAGVAARGVLTMQANGPPGSLAGELESGADFRLVVHQAAGMVAVQLDVSVRVALVRLRSHAFTNDRPISEVAEDIVLRRLRFDNRDDGYEQHLASSSDT